METKIFDTVRLALIDRGVPDATDAATEIVAALAVQRMIPVLKEYGVRLVTTDEVGITRENILAADSQQEAVQLAADLNAKSPSLDAKAFQRNSGPWYEADLVLPV